MNALATVMQQKTLQPLQFEITEQICQSVAKPETGARLPQRACIANVNRSIQTPIFLIAPACAV